MQAWKRSHENYILLCIAAQRLHPCWGITSTIPFLITILLQLTFSEGGSLILRSSFKSVSIMYVHLRLWTAGDQALS